MRLCLTFAFSVLLVAFSHEAAAQNWGSLAGRVMESPGNAPLPGVTVLINGSNFGTSTDVEGRYYFRAPEGRYALRFSSVGYETRIDSVTVLRGQITSLNVAMKPSLLELDGVTVEESASPRETGVYELDPEEIQNIPSPFRDGFRALKVLPGVASNNELSNQYSVRGGGFNENLIFINGFEVYLPFRPRQGEQEGLGLLNPDLAERITFYTGGFPARYGGKLSSALEVRYRRPESTALLGSAYLSLLDAGMTAGGSGADNRLSWTFGLRKAQAQRFFSTQELKGTYQPDFTDVQGTLSYRLLPGHDIEVLAILADHEFVLDPRSRKTYFGTFSFDPSQSDLRSLWVAYDSDSIERDGYATRFGGVKLSDRLSPRLRMEHDVAYFETEETEFFDLSGFSILYQVDPQSGNPQSGTGHLPVGNARQEDSADNRVRVSTLTGQGRWMLNLGRHAGEVGWQVRSLHFNDRLREQSAVSGRSREGDPVRIVVDSLEGNAELDAAQMGLYVQNALDVLPRSNQLVVTAGMRADYFSFNDEWTVSPRLSGRFQLSERTTLMGSAGLYYQAPTYRELRGKPLPGVSILGLLNRDIRSQRSVQVVAGVEHFLPKQRFFLRGEAYWKNMDNLISYDIENVRVNYSGFNDAKGYVYGLDLQLRGEFVPGRESWVNYSFMVARERFLEAYQNPYNQGLVPRPTDQRHTFSAFIQDYVPGDATWKIHLRALFGSGLPYTPPVPGPRLGNLTIQIPGRRFSGRLGEYKRLDAGITKDITIFRNLLERPVTVQLTAELLNVFDMVNTVAYTWVPGADGIWNRIPTRLTPRTLNVRLRVDF